MQVYLYVEINAIAFTILLLIYLNIRNKVDNKLSEQKLFLRLLAYTALILIFDTFMWVLDGRTSPISRSLLIFTTTVYYILNPVICMIWAIYIDFQVNHDSNRIRKLLNFLSIPVVINTVLSILSLFSNIYFYIDRNNVYHRGHYFLLVAILSFLYVIHTTSYVIKNRKKINRRFFISFLLIEVPPIIGAVLQLTFYGISLIWVGMTLSVLIIFINIQNEQMYMDYLTGLFNRRQLDFFLNETLQKENVTLAGIMLDLNSFKHINDHYGHYTGDEALRHTSKLLLHTFGNQAFLSRFGGDEFVILFEVNDISELEEAIARLKENVHKFNETKELPYEIHFSIGAALYPKGSKMNGQAFLNYIDTLMYEDKQTLFQETSLSSVCEQ
ncbi:MAG TPA: GGDEF domain-containing protein [Mobilitalea sp.]|nr:GGDEF domain-containing protein [Mobilitalea sp.]